MSYETALKKAWDDLVFLKAPNHLSVKFMADEYSLDFAARQVLSLSCNGPAKDLLSILVLHYLVQKLKGLPGLSGQWITFRELSGIQGYYDAYHKRSIEPVIRKYGQDPDAIKNVLSRLPAKLSEGGDVSIVVEAFTEVPVLIKLWKADSEFGPDANLYYDASIKNIFCIEDIVVLAQLVVGQL
ncbi:MAG: hypothetical protein COV73_02365 [Candidatus Omnitrophica bacterium CG11_big_fil_rev_8_21_14_0_20_43_6]|nr:MAG: hypothetical protein COV73_02365 [Candidatus Omnitrophica bacterium CG11_big_fil_rev_8_21_14_0_20_43_6]